MQEQYRIERLGHLGDGIAEGPVLVPLTLPGEVVTGRRTDKRLQDISILQPSPHRVAPPCPHFGSCGGCALQHASDAFVRSWKAEVVRRALAAQGLGVEFAGIATSAPHGRRRASLAGKRIRKGAIVGFHARASHEITPIDGCLVLAPQIMAALPALGEITALAAPRKGNLTFDVTVARDGLDVLVGGAAPPAPPARGPLVEIARMAGLARLSWGEETVLLAHPPIVDIAGIGLAIPPGGFLQATRQGQDALSAAVLAILKDAGPCLDLFAGAGTFALPLLRSRPVHAVESDRPALAALDAAWRRATGLRALTTEARDLFRRPLLPQELAPYDGAVVDPPRSGAAAQVEMLAQSPVTRLAMVSCNPVTFAADARRLVAGGYAMGPVRIVDQFRWSPHVELVAGFLRN